MAAELPRPGVEVIQVFRTVTPTVVSPTLVPCIVGVCKQIVEVLSTTATGASTLNSSALISLPGFFEAAPATGSPLAYTGLDGLDLVISITGGPDVTITFVGNSLSPAAVVAQINDAFATQGVTEAVAELSMDDTFFSIRTVGVGEFANVGVLYASSPAVLSAFGLIESYVYPGRSVYAQRQSQVPLLAFPDPRNNLDEISIEPDTVRVFFSLGSGTSLRELSRTTSHLRMGGPGSAASILGTVLLSTVTPLTSSLKVALDGGTETTITFTAEPDAAAIINKINTALSGVYATDDGGYLRITSKTKGSTSSVELTGPSTATLGLSTLTYVGDAGVQVVDDSNGDSFSPLIDFLSEDFTASAGVATVDGLVTLASLAYPADLVGKTLTLAVNGKDPQTLTFKNDGLNPLTNGADAATQVQNFWPELVVTGATVLHMVTLADGEDATIQVLGGTAAGTLGLVPSVTGAGLAADISDLAVYLAGKKIKFNLNGTAVEHTFGALATPGALSDIVTDLNGNATFAALAVAEAHPTLTDQLRVRLKENVLGNSFISVSAASSAEGAYLLGFDPMAAATSLTTVKGSGMKPVSGDDLYVDGNLVGRITSVAPGGIVNRLRVDKQLSINETYGERFYIVANKLNGTAGRPVAELVVSGDGVPSIKPNIIRDTTGAPTSAKVSVYMGYHAVRRDVTAKAKNPSLLRFDSTTQLETILAPINGLNPLALGLYFALLNAPGAQVSGIGVDAVSASYPYGTVEAFTRAAEALEQYEVYAIAPLTHDETVGEVFAAHVTSMSDPSSKGERICLFNYSQPDKKLDTLVTSGLTGNTIGATGLVFDTGVANLASLIQSKGIDPVGTIPVSSGLFLYIESSTKNFSVASVSGSVVTLRTSFLAGENDDSFYSTTPLSGTLIDEPFNVKVRGEPLVLPSSFLPDKVGIAETYQARAQSIDNRRVWSVVPDKAAATLGGIEQVIEGFYMSAAVAGMIAQQPPQQSFTNFPMTGFTRVIGSNDYFSEKQLNIIAAGGNYIIVQDTPGTPLISRMALTTDMTSLETRTDSITKIVDFTAKFMRQGLRSYIGRFNITQGFLDSLGHVCQGLLGFLVDIGVLIGGNLNNIVQDETSPDTVLIDVTLDVPFPCNYIRLTLVI